MPKCSSQAASARALGLGVPPLIAINERQVLHHVRTQLLLLTTGQRALQTVSWPQRPLANINVSKQYIAERGRQSRLKLNSPSKLLFIMLNAKHQYAEKFLVLIPEAILRFQCLSSRYYSASAEIASAANCCCMYIMILSKLN